MAVQEGRSGSNILGSPNPPRMLITAAFWVKVQIMTLHSQEMRNMNKAKIDCFIEGK